MTKMTMAKLMMSNLKVLYVAPCAHIPKVGDIITSLYCDNSDHDEDDSDDDDGHDDDDDDDNDDDFDKFWRQ